MIAAAHETLREALRRLIFSPAPPAARLDMAAATLLLLQPPDFSDWRLRARFTILRDELTMLDLPGAAGCLDEEAIEQLGVRIIGFCSEVAQSEARHE
jgi:hypothetical protein